MQRLFFLFIVMVGSRFTYAAPHFDLEFIERARALEETQPELYAGFKETDFDALNKMMAQKITYDHPEIKVIPEITDELLERIKKHDDNPQQKKLCCDISSGSARGALNYDTYLMYLFRHLALLRKNKFKAGEYEKIVAEIPESFSESSEYRTFGAGFFHQLRNDLPFADEAIVKKLIDYEELFLPQKALYPLSKQHEYPLNYFVFPLYDAHKLGIVYLAYMFWNHVYPFVCPDTQNLQKVHDMSMSPYGEFVHDLLHAKFSRGILDEGHFISTQITHLNIDEKERLRLAQLAEEKHDQLRKIINQIFMKAMQAAESKQLSPLDYRRLMSALFYTVHEDYLEGDLYAAEDFVGLIRVIFDYKAKKHKQVFEAIQNQAGYEVDDFQGDIPATFFSSLKMSMHTGKSPLSDEEILKDLATSKCQKELKGHIKRTPYFMFVFLDKPLNGLSYFAFTSPKMFWQLQKTNFPAIVNLSILDKQHYFIAPDLSLCKDEEEVRFKAFQHIRKMQYILVENLVISAETVMLLFSASEISQFNQAFAGIGNDL